MVFFRKWDYLKNARYMHIWGPSGRHVLHMGLLIHDRALEKITIFPGTPVMY